MSHQRPRRVWRAKPWLPCAYPRINTTLGVRLPRPIVRDAQGTGKARLARTWMGIVRGRWRFKRFRGGHACRPLCIMSHQRPRRGLARQTPVARAQIRI